MVDLTPHDRLHSIDALRGFSMILVVLGHVLLFMDLGVMNTPVSAVMTTFRMPLFFFVSGFFAFKPMHKWTSEVTINIVRRKACAQILCTFVFYTIYQICMRRDIFAWAEYGFRGYWFTIVLFQMFIWFLLFTGVARLFKREWVVTFLAISFAVSCAVCRESFDLMEARYMKIFSTQLFAQYFQYFAAGILARKYLHSFNRLLNNNGFRTISIVAYMLLLVLTLSPLHHAMNSFHRYLIIRNVAPYFGLLTLLIYFTSRSDYFSSKKTIPTTMCNIGRRTLDIYMLHYFFLPHLPIVAQYMGGSDMTSVQLIVAGAVCAVVVCLCMLISNVLRSSDILTEWLFGMRPTTKSVSNT